MLEPAPPGLDGALREAWQRYGMPLAVTEVHNGCTPRRAAALGGGGVGYRHRARREGVDIEAVTAWSLLGSHGWNTLLTAPGRYEAGAFDVTNGDPRPTALAGLWKACRLGRCVIRSRPARAGGGDPCGLCTGP